MFRRMHLAPEGEPVGTGGAAAAPVAPAAPPVAVAQVASTTEQEPHWLPARLERERVAVEKSTRAAILKEIGVADPAAAAKLVADEAVRVAAAKTLEQRAIEAETARDTERARVTALSGTVTAIATERMAGLTEGQRAAVTSIAGEDAAAQLKAISALAPTWGAPAAPPATPPAPGVAPAAPAPAVPPANTAPGPNAPGTAPTSPPDHKAEYKRLKAENPVQAAAYLNANESKIYPRA